MLTFKIGQSIIAHNLSTESNELGVGNTQDPKVGERVLRTSRLPLGEGRAACKAPEH